MEGLLTFKATFKYSIQNGKIPLIINHLLTVSSFWQITEVYSQMRGRIIFKNERTNGTPFVVFGLYCIPTVALRPTMCVGCRALVALVCVSAQL